MWWEISLWEVYPYEKIQRKRSEERFVLYRWNDEQLREGKKKGATSQQE